MRTWVICGLFLLTALAGCSDAPPATDKEDDGFKDIDYKVDDQTGAILGIVVNEVIEPVSGATITLQDGTGRSTQTDAQGRFVLDELDEGSYFLSASKPGHTESQFSAQVAPGSANPAIIKVQLPRLFEADPFMQAFSFEGFFTCSQNGVIPLWSSSPCVFDHTKHSLIPAPANGILPMLDNATPQIRDFHADVGAGWQSMIWEMTWEASAQGTSENMGIVVSTYKPERCTCHSFANYGSANPLRLQMDVGAPHETAAAAEPTAIPPEGIEQMSFFTSVRAPDGNINTGLGPRAPPGLAVDQDFTIFYHQFYYAAPPEGWSFLNGDGNPF